MTRRSRLLSSKNFFGCCKIPGISVSVDDVKIEIKMNK